MFSTLELELMSEMKKPVVYNDVNFSFFFVYFYSIRTVWEKILVYSAKALLRIVLTVVEEIISFKFITSRTQNRCEWFVRLSIICAYSRIKKKKLIRSIKPTLVGLKIVSPPRPALHIPAVYPPY